jgi:translocator protein
VAVAGSTTMQTGPNSWYAGLEKPWWQPPSWAFGPVWTALYVTIAIAGWWWWREGHVARTVMWWWSAQLLLNLTWSAVFFGLQRSGWALGVIVLVDAAVAATILVGWEIRRGASILMLPYSAWVLFATSLNAAIVSSAR